MELVHVFVLYVMLDGKKVSDDLFFWDIDRCIYFAQRAKQQSRKRITSYCLPKRINREGVEIY